MSTKYFYKGIPLEVLMSNGNSGGNPTTVQDFSGYLDIPTQTRDDFGTYQIGQVGYNIDGSINTFDRSMAYFINYNDDNTISLQNNPPFKTIYNSVSALLVGGGGGGGGGGGDGFGGPPGGSQTNNEGFTGNGGGGGGFNVVAKTSIANFNSIVFTVGKGGNGGALGDQQGAQQTQGFNGQDGSAGTATSLYFYTSPTVFNVSANANGGGGGGGGLGGTQRNPVQGQNSGTIGFGGTGQGGFLSVSGQDGGLPSVAALSPTVTIQVPARGGINGKSPLHPSFNFDGGDAGLLQQSAQDGQNGIIRLYFFNS